MIRHKTLLMACAVVMLCTTVAPQKSFGIDIVSGQTYENYTNAGEFAGFYGGVVVNRNDLKVLNNTFRNNTNTNGAVYGIIPGGGGAIYDYGGTLTINDSIFDSNRSTAEGFLVGGGALMLYQTKSADISGTTFNQNSGYSGGAIYL